MGLGVCLVIEKVEKGSTKIRKSNNFQAVLFKSSLARRIQVLLVPTSETLPLSTELKRLLLFSSPHLCIYAKSLLICIPNSKENEFHNHSVCHLRKDGHL
ncbi:hypothetical protein NC652_019321 [Populus alba x Populus x berolinensis]|nr:hypothetical protein NC652_019321 [Populus alba x Populus x berolinensis]